MRRIAKQSRSRATVAAVEQAAALIIEAGQSAKLTTNHIAERAGVSIGSLYEYFSSKDDILRSCCAGEAERMGNELNAAWRASKSGNEQKLDLAMILALPLAPFKSRPESHVAPICTFTMGIGLGAATTGEAARRDWRSRHGTDFRNGTRTTYRAYVDRGCSHLGPDC